MNIGILTHESTSHITGIEQLIRSLSRDNKVYVILREEFRSLLPKGENIFPITFSKSTTDSVFKYYREYVNKYIGLGTNRTLYKMSDYVNEVEEPLRYLLKGNKIYAAFCKEALKKLHIDILFRDPCALYGREVANYLTVPVVGYTTSSIIDSNYIKLHLSDALEDIFNWDLSFMTESDIKELKILIEVEISRISKTFGISKLPIAYLQDPGEKFNICFSIPWTHDIEKNKYKMVKPSIFSQGNKTNGNIEELKDDIYIATGSETVFTGNIYNCFINAFKDRKEKVFISFKYTESDLIHFNKLPKNIFFEKYSNQKERLENSKLFITHGGYNSIQESIFFKVPMLVIPISSDMFFNARMIQKNGLGVKINKKNVTTKAIHNATNNLFSDNSFSININNMWDKTNSLDDISKVIDQLI